jgi:hypothetical protein
MASVMRPPVAHPRGLRLVFVLTLVAGIFVAGAPAGACSCVEMDLGSRLPEADGAFVGTFVDRSEISDQLASITFDVERVVKGEFGPRAIVRTNAYGASCGLEFLDGPRIGLLLDRASDGVWESSLCQQVRPSVLLAVGGDPPDPDVSAVSARMSTLSIVLIGVSAAVAVALLVLALIARRGRSRPEESGVA